MSKKKRISFTINEDCDEAVVNEFRRRAKGLNIEPAKFLNRAFYLALREIDSKKSLDKDLQDAHEKLKASGEEKPNIDESVMLDNSEWLKSVGLDWHPRIQLNEQEPK